MKLLNEILGTKYPIIQGGMANIATGEFAAACSRAYTPAANAAGGEILPPGAKLAWLGWDYIRSHDLEAVAGASKDVFFAEWERTHREGRMFL